MSLAEERTRAFYNWEVVGRGLTVHSHTVRLEPPFKPFPGHEPTQRSVVDDSRRPNLFSSLAGWLSTPPATTASVPVQREELAFAAEPFEWTEELHECEILVPADERVDVASSLAWLHSIGNMGGVLSFELVARAGQVGIRVAAVKRDSDRIRDHMRTMLPRVVVRPAARPLNELFHDCDDGIVGAAEFGLRHEFMLPLNELDRSSDIFTPLLAVLARIGEREFGVFQVLFQPVQSDWAANAIVAVHTPSGEPFFTDGKEVTKLAIEKCSQRLYACTIRALVSVATRDLAEDFIFGTAAALEQCGNSSRNELISLEISDLKPVVGDVLNRTTHRSGMILSHSDLAVLVHLPAPSVCADCLIRPSTKTKAAPAIALTKSFVLGANDHDGVLRQVGLGPEARLRHSYIVGASGTGKSTMLLSMIVQDIEAGNGVAVLDPHGDLIDDVLVRIPESRAADVVLFDPSDEEYPVGFNILSAHSELEKSLLSSDLVGVFKRLSTSFGDQMVAVLGNAVLAFLESSEGGTLVDLRRFLIDKGFRARFLDTVMDEQVVSYWQDEYPLLKGVPTAPILTRLNTFLRPKLLRYMVAQKRDRLDMRALMDGRKILLAKLSQGAIGEENAHLLGSLLVAKVSQAAMSRQDVGAATRVPFFLYIDEFHHFVTPSIATILSAARKYRLSLTLAHQETRQLKSRSEDVASAVLANAYTRVVFRIGEHDARGLADGFSFFDARDLQNLGIGEAVARVERPEFDFNLRTIPVEPIEEADANKRRTAIVSLSRRQFAAPRAEIEALLRQEHELTRKRRGAGESAARTARASAAARNVDAPGPADQEVGLPGRGGTEHKYLQELVRQLGEERGFAATIEKRILGGHGHVDVALERDDLTIGCEISVSTRASHEAGNLAKCIAAGFDYAVMLTTKDRVRRLARLTMAGSESDRMKFLTPEGFIIFLDALTKRRGPRVKQTIKPTVDGHDSGGLISAHEAAAYLGLQPQSLAKMRVYGTSPPFFKLGRQVMYKTADLDTWLASRRRQSTSTAT